MRKVKKLKTSKKGIPILSQLTGNNYLVYKWYDLGDGKIEVLDKKKVSLQIALDRFQEIQEK